MKQDPLTKDLESQEVEQAQELREDRCATQVTAQGTNEAADDTGLHPSNGINGRPAEGGRGEMSATTIARLMGVATLADINLIESKIELMSNRIHNLTVRMEKVLTILAQAPSGSDLERIDVQIAHLRTMIKDSLLSRLKESDYEDQELKPVSKDDESAE